MDRATAMMVTVRSVLYRALPASLVSFITDILTSMHSARVSLSTSAVSATASSIVINSAWLAPESAASAIAYRAGMYDSL